MIIDYETFPLSRKEIRSFAKMMRTILGIKTLKFPVLDCSIDYICHEICHFFLIEVFGYYPIYNVCLSENRQIPKYRSMEWQAKALCGEVMIDYKKCSNMTISDIMKKTGSSIDQACFYKMFVANK